MIIIETHFLIILFTLFFMLLLGFLIGTCFITDKKDDYNLKFRFNFNKEKGKNE